MAPVRGVVAAFAAGALLLLAGGPVAAQPDTVGQWTAIADLPPPARHMIVLVTGQVMFFSADDTTLWDPVTDARTYVGPAGYFIFCGGHTYLPDGRVLVGGGHITNNVGRREASIFDPFTRTWTALPPMNDGRWYPTTTTLPNGDVLVISGDIDTTVGINRLPQVWETANSRWRDLTSAQLAVEIYPYMHVLPDGRLFQSGPGATTRFLDPSGTGAWTPGPSRGTTMRDYGSSVMYQPGKVLFVGGGNAPTNEALVIDLTAVTPTWRAVAPMATARRQLNATLLPDGRVLVTGGTSGPGFNNTTTPVFAAEIWDPLTEQWTTLASASVPRLYHSTAALLPDGTILSGGTDGVTQAEVFSPPYLFKGPRPTITAAPARLGYGRPFALETPDADAVTRVTLLALGSVTHGFSQSQRFLELGFTHRPGGLDAVAPASGTVAPPGPYILFALNGDGVPSVGAIVQVGPEGGQRTLTSVTPGRVVAGASDFTVSVRGGGFTNASVVRWNGSDRPTTFVAPTQLDAVIQAADVATVGTASVTVTDPAVAATSNALTFSIDSTVTLTVAQAGTGEGLVASSPTGIQCPDDCSEPLGSTPLTLTATPAPGSTFTGWSGGGCTGTGPCTVAGNVATLVTATFATGPPTFTLSGTTATPNPVTRGATTVIQTTASDIGSVVSNVLVNLEIYSSSGVRVHQQQTTGQSFGPGEGRTLQWTWPVPATLATGTYTIKFGFFSSNWATLYTWVNNAGPVTVQASAPLTLSVSRNGGGAGTVTSAPAGITCGTDCTEAYASGTAVTLTATPAAGAVFTGWNGDCTGTGACAVTMSAARTVAATFEPSYTLTVSRAGAATGTATSAPAGITCGSDCTEAYASGTAVTLTATPASGATFSGWSGDCTGTGPCAVTMTANRAVTASFGPSGGSYPLTVIQNGTGGGTVTSAPAGISCGTDCTEAYASGTPVTLTATPAAGAVFTGWSGDCTGTGPCAVTMSAAHTVTATFGPTYTLTVSRAGAATGTVTSAPAGISCGSDCTEAYASGTLVTLTATPAAGAVFTGWSGDCTGTGPCTVTMTANRAATASFAPSGGSYLLTVTRNGTGSGTVTSIPSGVNCGTDCAEAYASGTAGTLTATPAAGSVLSGWLGACTASSGPCSVTMDANRAVTVTFTRQTTGAPRFTADLVTATPNPVARGTSTVVAATVTNTGGPATGIKVDLEIYASSGARVYQQVTSGQDFQSGQRRTLQWTWPVPTTLTTGTYTIRLGFFSSNWATLYTWVTGAGSLAVK